MYTSLQDSNPSISSQENWVSNHPQKLLMNICICLKFIKIQKFCTQVLIYQKVFYFLVQLEKILQKKSDEPFFSQAYFLIHLIQNCPKMKTENSGWSFKIVYHQWDWSLLWSGIVCYLRIATLGWCQATLMDKLQKWELWKKPIALHIKSRNWKKKVMGEMWIIGIEMESSFG